MPTGCGYINIHDIPHHPVILKDARLTGLQRRGMLLNTTYVVFIQSNVDIMVGTFKKLNI